MIFKVVPREKRDTRPHKEPLSLRSSKQSVSKRRDEVVVYTAAAVFRDLEKDDTRDDDDDIFRVVFEPGCVLRGRD